MYSAATTVNLPYGAKATGVTVRDGFTNDNALIIFDKKGSVIAAIPGSATSAASAWSSVANEAVINGAWVAVPQLAH